MHFCVFTFQAIGCTSFKFNIDCCHICGDDLEYREVAATLRGEEILVLGFFA